MLLMPFHRVLVACRTTGLFLFCDFVLFVSCCCRCFRNCLQRLFPRDRLWRLQSWLVMHVTCGHKTRQWVQHFTVKPNFSFIPICVLYGCYYPFNLHYPNVGLSSVLCDICCVGVPDNPQRKRTKDEKARAKGKWHGLSGSRVLLSFHPFANVTTCA